MAKRKLSRRRFLQAGSGAAVAGPMLAPGIVEAQPRGRPQVLIIGAGMGGVSASYFLRKLGIGSLILEARDRIGGRLWSSRRWPDAILDLGGAWIHDSLSNPLTALAKQWNIQTKLTDYGDAIFRSSTGANLDPLPILKAYGTIAAAVARSAAALQARGFPDRPYGTEFEKALAALNPPPPILGGIRTLEDVAVRGLGAEPSDESLYHFGEDVRVVGVQDLSFPKGYVQIVERLAQGQQILYGHVVKQIRYNPQGVTIATNRGNFSAKYAVVTLPFGVLKSGNVEFIPALPASKQGAIRRLQTGFIDKLILRFPRTFWDTNSSFILRTKPPTDRFVWWVNGNLLTGKPILLGFVTADYAREVESLSDSEVVKRLMAVLRSWYPQIQVPNPVDFQRSRWMADPFAYGAYPHIPVGASPADYDLMAQPVPYAPGLPASANRLFFAGDGTTRDFPGTVNGAYETGRREANRIQQAMR